MVKSSSLFEKDSRVLSLPTVLLQRTLLQAVWSCPSLAPRSRLQYTASWRPASHLGFGSGLPLCCAAWAPWSPPRTELPPWEPWSLLQTKESFLGACTLWTCWDSQMLLWALCLRWAGWVLLSWLAWPFSALRVVASPQEVLRCSPELWPPRTKPLSLHSHGHSTFTCIRLSQRFCNWDGRVGGLLP